MIYITMYYTAPISNRVVPLPCAAFSTFIASQASNSLRLNSSVAACICWSQVIPRLSIHGAQSRTPLVVVVAVVVTVVVLAVVVAVVA
jgi:magnesium-transporting ATPase (P-type)